MRTRWGIPSEDRSDVAFGRSTLVGTLPRVPEGGQVPSPTRVQEQIAARMLAGHSLDRVEEEVINDSDFTDNQKSALWLYAWSFIDGGTQRDWAERYVAHVAAG